MKREERKNRKLKKKMRRWYNQIYSNRENYSMPIYILLQTMSVIVEIIRRLFVGLLWIIGLSGVACAIIGTVILIKLFPTYERYQNDAITMVSNSSEEDFQISESSIVYDTNGNILATLCEGSDMTYLEYQELPRDVVNAFIAVEDRSFWENPGIDIRGLIRVGYRFLITKGEEVHGASTITQQLARNIFLTHEVSIERKVKEILISLQLTEKYSKQDIMEYYCNNICFGNGI